MHNTQYKTYTLITMLLLSSVAQASDRPDLGRQRDTQEEERMRSIREKSGEELEREVNGKFQEKYQRENRIFWGGIAVITAVAGWFWTRRDAAQAPEKEEAETTAESNSTNADQGATQSGPSESQASAPSNETPSSD